MKFSLFDQLIVRLPSFPFFTAYQMRDDPHFIEMLSLASNDFKKEYVKSIDVEEASEKLRGTARKYITRAATRATPFGLFSGTGIIKWGKNENRLTVEKSFRKTNLNADYLIMISDYLLKFSEVKSVLRFSRNNTIYKLGDKYRYVESGFKNFAIYHRFASIKSNDFVEEILSYFKQPHTYDEGLEFLLNYADSKDDSKDFFQELIDNQLVVSELSVELTGVDPLLKVISILSRIESKKGEVSIIEKVLIEVKILLDEVDTSFAGNDRIYEKIRQLLTTLPVPYLDKYLFRCDKWFTFKDPELNDKYKAPLSKAVEYLISISNKENLNLTQFKKEFLDRYETEEIPLNIALDPDVGINYFHGLRTPLTFDDEKTLTLTEYEVKLFHLVLRSIQSNNFIIDLKGGELPNAKNNSTAATFFAYFSLNTDSLILKSCGGSSSLSAIGRLGKLSDKHLEFAKEIAAYEKNFFKGKLIGELIHYPIEKLGNSMFREKFFEYEIPYCDKSSVSEDREINIDDLQVSVKNNRIILRSKKHNKVVIPRLSNPHNYSTHSLPVYRFLADLQFQECYYDYSFSWGKLPSFFKSLPRVTYKGVILSEALWCLSRPDFKVLFDSKTLKKNLNSFLTKFKIPNRALLVDFDNALFIDFSDDQLVSIFIGLIKTRTEIVLREFIYDENQTQVVDASGNGHRNQFVAFFKTHEAEETNFEIVQDLTDVERLFTVGSDWVYYKVYTGQDFAESILSKLHLLFFELKEMGYIDHWFFIRYSDPDFHLRIRFFLPKVEKRENVLNKLRDFFLPMLKEKSVFKICLDTYVRELERYNPLCIEDIESLFCIDSEFVAQALFSSKKAPNSIDRFELSIAFANSWLSCFYEKESDRLKMLSNLPIIKDSNEQYRDRKIVINKNYRRDRERISSILENGIDTRIDMLMAEREKLISPIVKKVRETLITNGFENQTHNIFYALIHLTFNRFSVELTFNLETTVLAYLFKYYRSFCAKG